MRAIVNVYLKEGVLDPQGKAIHHALETLGFNGIKSVRVGKQIALELEETDKIKAKESINKMCEMLLANTVIEDYEIVL